MLPFFHRQIGYDRATCGSRLLVILFVFSCFSGNDKVVVAQKPLAEDDQRSIVVPEAVQTLQKTIVTTIARVERSVVAVARSKRIPQAEILQTRQPRILGQVAQPPDPLAQLRTPRPSVPPYAYGSGVVIDESGLILTQYLVVNSEDDHFINDVDGNTYKATIRATDPRSGLAVLAINPLELAIVREKTESLLQPDGSTASILPALKMGEAEKLSKGDFVISLGNPYAIQSDGQPTSSWGTISNIARKAAAEENFNNAPDTRGGFRTTLHHFGSLIQTDAKLGWNSAGGALVNLSGELVGITTTAASIAGHEQPAGYAIPLNETMRRVVQTLSEGKEAEYALMGVSFSSTSPYNAGDGFLPNPNSSVIGSPLKLNESKPSGVRLDKAYLGGPGYRGGLRTGDYVVSINEIPIPDSDALQLVIGSRMPGEKVSVLYRRANKQEETTIELGKAFVMGERIVTQKPTTWRGMRIDYATALPGDVLLQATEQGQVDPLGCVAVVEVEKGSISDQSGVKPYMFISHVGGQRVSNPKEFYEATESATDTVKLKFTERQRNPLAP